MSDIFISYSHEDRACAESIVRMLNANDYKVCWDEDLLGGTRFDSVLDRMLENSKCVVVIWSHNASTSNWVIGEINKALEMGNLLTIKIDETSLYTPLRALLWIDFKKCRESDNLDFEKKLLESVEFILAKNQKDLPLEFSDQFGIEFLHIESGTFNMGSDIGNDDEQPVHEIEITAPFYVSKYPITEEEFRKVTKGDHDVSKTGAVPKVNVSWNEVKLFIDRLNTLNTSNGCYRLPTEAEWEYMCRAGTNTEYFFGAKLSDLTKYAWYKDNSYEPQPVGGLAPNPWGLFDCIGNVWEWVEDRYEAAYYEESVSEDPKGPDTGKFRVIRGGSCISGEHYCRSAFRDYEDSSSDGSHIGFRLVYTPFND